MAKRKARPSVRKAKSQPKSAARRSSAKRPKARRSRKTPAKLARRGKRTVTKPVRRSSSLKTAPKRASRSARKTAGAAKAVKVPRLDRARRTLVDTMQTPPSSLDMDRRGSAARTGRAEMQESRELHGAMTTAITGGDVDVNLEQAYFSGDEAPGGDNPTPDQDVVDDFGRALGVEYQDNEELRASDKVAARDKKRWELDPASSEDYKERK
jgi:hypothetical protein